MAELDREHNGIIWYCGVSNMNTERANKVWRIFGRYQANIVHALGREPVPKRFPFRNAAECHTQLSGTIKVLTPNGDTYEPNEELTQNI